MDGRVIINVNESSVDRSVKNQYSWLPKDENSPILNDNVKGKTTLILGSWSTGEWFSVVMVDIIDSLKFCVFLNLLENIINKSTAKIEDFPTVVLNNARTHPLKLTKRVIEHLPYGVRFSAPYWPEVAPVKQAFQKIKSKIRNWGWETTIKFEKAEGI